MLPFFFFCSSLVMTASMNWRRGANERSPPALFRSLTFLVSLLSNFFLCCWQTLSKIANKKMTMQSVRVQNASLSRCKLTFERASNWSGSSRRCSSCNSSTTSFSSNDGKHDDDDDDDDDDDYWWWLMMIDDNDDRWWWLTMTMIDDDNCNNPQCSIAVRCSLEHTWMMFQRYNSSRHRRTQTSFPGTDPTPPGAYQCRTCKLQWGLCEFSVHHQSFVITAIIIIIIIIFLFFMIIIIPSPQRTLTVLCACA